MRPHDVLTARIAATGCPIYGVSIDPSQPKQSWYIDFDPAATQSQRDAAQAVLQAFDFSATQTSEANKLAAQKALDASDVTFARCGKAGVAWPSEWQTYVLALRACVTSGNALPTRPAFPAGS